MRRSRPGGVSAYPLAGETPDPLEKTVYISGLICAHCVAHVEKALKGLPGAGYEAAAITNT